MINQVQGLNCPFVYDRLLVHEHDGSRVIRALGYARGILDCTDMGEYLNGVSNSDSNDIGFPSPIPLITVRNRA